MTSDEQNSPRSGSVVDGCAEFTLRLVRAGQEALSPRSSLRNWFFLPEPREASWSEAREILAGAAKPLIVAPLLEPGCIAIWSVSTIEPARRARVDHELANQCAYWDEKLAVAKLDDTDHIETPDGLFTLTVAEFRRWAAEYAVSIGIGMGASPLAGTGRIHIMLPGGGGPPVGWVKSERLTNVAPHTHRC